MLRTLFGVVILLAMPALLSAQAPANRGMTHGIATQVQGEAVMADEMDGHSNQAGMDEADGDNNQEGVNEQDGPNNEEGLGEPDGLNNESVGDQAGEDQGSNADPSDGGQQNSGIGSHRP